jgi:O-methyltransferase
VLARLRSFLGMKRDARRFRRTFHKFRDFTMIPEDLYTANLQLALQVKKIPGAIVECGTWRGGMIAGMADILGPERHYFLFDSFEGLPPAKKIDGDAALAWQRDTASPVFFDNCRASEGEAKTAMSMSAARQVTVIKGWFSETLPNASTGPIAILRMDADWYDSTKQILESLACLVVAGGVIIVDDYYAWEGCARAVNECAAEKSWMIRQFWRAGVCFIKIPEKP